MKLWWLPTNVAIALIVAGTVLFLGATWLAEAPRRTTEASAVDNLFVAGRFVGVLLGIGLGAGMIINGIARSTRPPEQRT